MISFLTFGEGYHNYHHCFASDYRNGIKWYHFDPTKWLIWGLSKLGLAKDLKQIDIYKVRRCMVKKDKDRLLDWMQQLSYVKMEVLEQKINEAAEHIIKQISNVHALMRQYKEQKKNRVEKNILKQLQQEIKQLKKIYTRIGKIGCNCPITS